ncbi:MAG: hypothetical protein ACL93V_02620 [Candidatus Electrothrix sp. YB6]
MPVSLNKELNTKAQKKAGLLQPGPIRRRSEKNSQLPGIIAPYAGFLSAQHAVPASWTEWLSAYNSLKRSGIILPRIGSSLALYSSFIVSCSFLVAILSTSLKISGFTVSVHADPKVIKKLATAVPTIILYLISLKKFIVPPPCYIL